MNEQTVEVLSRAAASVSRRGSLLTLGGALAAAITAPSLVEAKKNSKKANKAKKRKAQQRAAEQAENEANLICQSQVAGCRARILAECDGPTCPAAADCCSFFGACDFSGFFTCLISVTN
jgi:hypothetical protein